MNHKELVDKVSSSTGVAVDTVQKVLDAAIAAINKATEGEDPVRVGGLGTFMRRKKGEVEKVVFKAQLTKDQKQAKKAKRREAKGAAAE